MKNDDEFSIKYTNLATLEKTSEKFKNENVCATDNVYSQRGINFFNYYIYRLSEGNLRR